MNNRIFCLIVGVLFTLGSSAQLSIPKVNELSFAAVAADYNTYNDKHVPMSFLSGFSLEGDEETLMKNPIEIMFNPFHGVDRDDCKLLRWDPVVRVWTKFSGNTLRQTHEGSGLYWSGSVNSPGIYALMRDLDMSGKTTLQLPDGYKVERWRYVQSNAGVVCESQLKGTALEIPLPAISPLAELSMRCRVNGKQLEEFGYAPAGTLVKRLWKDPAAVNAAYNMEITSTAKK